MVAFWRPWDNNNSNERNKKKDLETGSTKKDKRALSEEMQLTVLNVYQYLYQDGKFSQKITETSKALKLHRRDRNGFSMFVFVIKYQIHLLEELKRKKMRGHLSKSDKSFRRYITLKSSKLFPFLERNMTYFEQFVQTLTKSGGYAVKLIKINNSR